MEARDICSVWLSPWWGQEEKGWLGVFIFAEWLYCGFVILKWICPAWDYCQELNVCFLWCFAQHCSRLPLCKINLPSICAPYIGFNYGEVSLQNQVSGSAGDSARGAVSSGSYPPARAGVCWPQCRWQGEWAAMLVGVFCGHPSTQFGQLCVQ